MLSSSNSTQSCEPNTMSATALQWASSSRRDLNIRFSSPVRDVAIAFVTLRNEACPVNPEELNSSPRSSQVCEASSSTGKPCLRNARAIKWCMDSSNSAGSVRTRANITRLPKCPVPLTSSCTVSPLRNSRTKRPASAQAARARASSSTTSCVLERQVRRSGVCRRSTDTRHRSNRVSRATNQRCSRRTFRRISSETRRTATKCVGLGLAPW
mmetsp:Transcript_8841/g.22890  ORF Transcript_8841/g.22890 Transcript_8841/m.22890 type:complete len:212 (-) Transcript_8841:57-692(-)